MSTMTPMVEYLLALRLPTGGQLCRFGGLQTTVPIFPANTAITWSIAPYFGSYASIEFWHRFSPAMVPGAFNVVSRHVGLELVTGVIGASWTLESHNFWVEITEANNITTTITNISGLNQFFETFETFLLIDSEANMDYVREVVRNWGAFESVRPTIEETNNILRQMLGSGGPQLPITRGGR